MSAETANILPTVLLIVMVALTLVLLPRLNDERRPRRDAPHPEETPPRDE